MSARISPLTDDGQCDAHEQLNDLAAATGYCKRFRPGCRDGGAWEGHRPKE